MFDELLDRFVNYLRVEKGLSANTLESYSRDLVGYLHFLEARGFTDVLLTRTDTLYAYLKELRARNLSSRSQARALSALRSFHRFLQEEGLRADDPLLPLQSPTPKRTLPKTLSGLEVENLLDQPRTDSPRGLRDAAMLEVLYAAGLRVSEIISLTLDQLELEAGLIRTVGKGSKERLIPISSLAGRRLEDYLTSGRPSLLRGRTSPHVFLNQTGTPSDPPGILENFKAVRPAGRHTTVRFPPIPCGTPLPPICWRGERIYGPFKPCWGMRTSPPPRFTPR